MTLLSLGLAVAAFALLGLATDEHHRRWCGSRLAADVQQRRRRSAWPVFLVSFALAVADAGWAMGSVLWCGLVMLAAGAVFLFLNFAPPVRGLKPASNTHERTDR